MATKTRRTNGMDAWQRLCVSMGTRCSHKADGVQCDGGVTRFDRCAEHQRPTYRGTVAGSMPGYLRVDCPDAPSHMQQMYLVPGQMGGAKLGDTVELEYQITSRSGLWNVAAIL